MLANALPHDSGWFNRERVLIVALGLATLLALYVSTSSSSHSYRRLR